MDLKGKRLLILGATTAEEQLVLSAKEMGVYTVVTDYNRDHRLSPAKKAADEVWYISWADINALKEKCCQCGIDGVVAGYSEQRIECAMQLCKELGLPFYITRKEHMQFTCDKASFKATCREYGVPVVDEFDYVQAKTQNYRNIELPVVVKPVDNSGSRGISVCYTDEELREGIEKALDNSQSKRILIEKYMTGDEVVIYYTFQNGKPLLTAMCDRYTNKEQAGLAQLPTSYIFPSRYLPQYRKAVDQKVKNMFQGLEIENGIMFLQAFIDEGGGVRIYEPGFRLAGAQEHFVVAAATGVDTKKYMIHHALTGSMWDEDLSKIVRPEFGKWGCKLSPLIRTGKIVRIDGLEKLAAMPEMAAIVPNYQEGDVVSEQGTLKQIACRFFLVADTKEKLKEAIDTVHNTFLVEDENGESMFLSHFDTDIILHNYGANKELQQ